MSDKALYPYFARTAPPDSIQTVAIVELCREMGWKRVAVLNANTDFHRDISQSFVERFIAVPGNQVLFQHTIDTEDVDILPNLQAMEDAGVRVVFLSVRPSYANSTLFQTIQSQNVMNGKDVVWIGTDWPFNFAIDPALTTDPNEGSSDDNFAAASGTLAFAPLSGSGTFFDAYLDAWVQRSNIDPANFPDQDGDNATLNVWSPASYDATVAMAKAIDAVQREGGLASDGPEVYASILTQSFVGASGLVQFDAQGDRLGQYQLVNMVDRQMKPVAIWDPNNGFTFDVATPITWKHGGSEIPTDGSCPNDCSGHGSCTLGAGICTCFQGFEGEDCAQVNPTSLSLTQTTSSIACQTYEVFLLPVEMVNSGTLLVELTSTVGSPNTEMFLVAQDGNEVVPAFDNATQVNEWAVMSSANVLPRASLSLGVDGFDVSTVIDTALITQIPASTLETMQTCCASWTVTDDADSKTLVTSNASSTDGQTILSIHLDRTLSSVASLRWWIILRHVPDTTCPTLYAVTAQYIPDHVVDSRQTLIILGILALVVQGVLLVGSMVHFAKQQTRYPWNLFPKFLWVGCFVAAMCSATVPIWLVLDGSGPCWSLFMGLPCCWIGFTIIWTVLVLYDAELGKVQNSKREIGLYLLREKLKGDETRLLPSQEGKRSQSSLHSKTDTADATLDIHRQQLAEWTHGTRQFRIWLYGGLMSGLVGLGCVLWWAFAFSSDSWSSANQRGIVDQDVCYWNDDMVWLMTCVSVFAFSGLTAWIQFNVTHFQHTAQTWIQQETQFLVKFLSGVSLVWFGLAITQDAADLDVIALLLWSIPMVLLYRLFWLLWVRTSDMDKQRVRRIASGLQRQDQEDESLVECLSTKLGQSWFGLFCEKEFAFENPVCYLIIKKFQHHTSWSSFQNICTRFVERGALLEINISSQQRDTLILCRDEGLANAEKIPSTEELQYIFNDVMGELLGMMNQSFDRFKTSSLYDRYLQREHVNAQDLSDRFVVSSVSSFGESSMGFPSPQNKTKAEPPHLELEPEKQQKKEEEIQSISQHVCIHDDDDVEVEMEMMVVA